VVDEMSKKYGGRDVEINCSTSFKGVGVMVSSQGECFLLVVASG